MGTIELNLDNFESKSFGLPKFDLTEKLNSLNKVFNSEIKPINGVYGITELDMGNGITRKFRKDNQDHIYSEYFREGKLYKRREKNKVVIHFPNLFFSLRLYMLSFIARLVLLSPVLY